GEVLFDCRRVSSASHGGPAHIAFGCKESLRPQRQGYFGAQSHTPRNSCVRFAAGVAAGLAQHSPPGGLLSLTCAGLSPADRASFLALLCPPDSRACSTPRSFLHTRASGLRSRALP